VRVSGAGGRHAETSFEVENLRGPLSGASSQG
jgi:hypothetical protein